MRMQVFLAGALCIVLASPAFASSNSSAGAISGSQAGSVSTSTATNAGNAQELIQNQYSPADQTIRTAPTVYAPAIAGAITGTCAVPLSAGVSVIGVGATLGGTHDDAGCNRRYNADVMATTLGDREAGRNVMCEDKRIFDYYEAIGNPCRLRPDGSMNPDWRPPVPPVAIATPEPAPQAAPIPPPQPTPAESGDTSRPES